MDFDPIIVVSDVHLGSDESNASAFYHFCDWIKGLWCATEGKLIATEGKLIINGPPKSPQRRIKAPKTLILLGDILELWAPEAHAAPLRDGFTVFDQLLALPCDKVYVLGNHDESLGDSCFFGKPKGASGSPACARQEYECANGSQFLVVNGHYPNHRHVDRHDKDYPKERDEVAGEEVVPVERKQGSTKPPRQYIFLHGYQFDKMFRLAGPLRSIPGYMKVAADLVNKIHTSAGPTGLVLFMVLAVLGWTNWLNVAAIIGQFAWWILILVSLGVGIVWAWAKLQKPAWTYVFRYFADRPRCSTIQKIIEEQYYDSRLDKTNPCSIIVFGHTHVPGSKVVEKEQMPKYSEKERTNSSARAKTKKTKTKTFINCGSWMTPKKPAKNAFLKIVHKLRNVFATPKKQGQKDPVPSNTFLYIDREGPPLLLQWNDDKDKRYVQGFKPPEESPAC